MQHTRWPWSLVPSPRALGAHGSPIRDERATKQEKGAMCNHVLGKAIRKHSYEKAVTTRSKPMLQAQMLAPRLAKQCEMQKEEKAVRQHPQ